MELKRREDEDDEVEVKEEPETPEKVEVNDFYKFDVDGNALRNDVIRRTHEFSKSGGYVSGCFDKLLNSR